MNYIDNRPRAVSLFTGAGGLDLGLDAAGFHTVFASDIDTYSCETLMAGRDSARKLGKPILDGAQIVCSDVKALNGQEILRSIGLQRGELDLVAGGPPCQAFSVFGRRKGKEDPRGMLAWEFIRLLRELKPKTFIFENVYGLLTIDSGSVFEELRKELSAPGADCSYNITVLRLNAVNFGVPQYRDRIFICGSMESIIPNNIQPICSEQKEILTPRLLPARKVVDGLRNLPPMGSPDVPNHIGRKHSQRIIDRYASMSAGERDKHTRINKLDLNRPSFTIIVGSDAGGGKGHIHPTEPREVTPRESARMQTFPDWWAFSGKGRHPIRQVGNAVPPLLGAMLGKHILEQHFSGHSRSYRDIIGYLSANHLFDKSDLLRLDEIEQAHLNLRKMSYRPAKSDGYQQIRENQATTAQ